MEYHALIKTIETGELYEFDHDSLESIKESIITPYLLNQAFQFDGYFIEPSKVKRFVVLRPKSSDLFSGNSSF